MIPLSSISKARRYFTGEEIRTLHEETGWSQDGQSIAARSTGDICVSASPTASPKSLLSQHFTSKIQLLCQQLEVTEPLGIPITFAFTQPRLRQHAEGRPQKASLSLPGSCLASPFTNKKWMLTLSTATRRAI